MTLSVALRKAMTEDCSAAKSYLLASPSRSRITFSVGEYVRVLREREGGERERERERERGGGEGEVD